MRKNLFLVFVLLFLGVWSAKAQVTVGGNPDPDVPGALLNLNSTLKGGLLLSNVGIIELDKIPVVEDNPNIFPGIVAGVNDGPNTNFTGAVVYNTNIVTGRGVYIWTGTKWTKDGSDN
ncbi:MAG: hypothetical protein LBO74_03560 [Candidatus Symbiothrix sp.]|jgi:hypothetical protein|nr:hypothetical protein [Candidatus Symbiothrix sp.]